MTAKPSILIVEDEPALRHLARVSLRDDFVVDEAADGAAALERVAARHYDLILLDVAMPGIDGYAVCTAIRALPRGREPKIVFCTAYGAAGDRARGQAAGGDAYVVKPYRPTALRAQLKDLLAAAATPGAPSTPLATPPPPGT